jgi:hypothetical protein
MMRSLSIRTLTERAGAPEPSITLAWTIKVEARTLELSRQAKVALKADPNR